jgi:hypothetical protein
VICAETFSTGRREEQDDLAPVPLWRQRRKNGRAFIGYIYIYIYI